PVITSQPASRTNNAGTTATFAVTVSGTAPLSYQWKKGALTLSDGGNISGATSPILTLTGVSAAEAASYTVFISNAVGNATSIAATLTVIDPPVITSQPLGRTNNAGTTATFTVAATGTAPSYQWFKNGTNSLSDTGNVSGSTSNVLTLAGVFGADRGEYTVVVSNAAGTLTSSNATLVVIDPAILTQPADVTAINGSTVSFTVNAVGTAPLSYRWQVDGFDLVDGFGVSGATTASLTITGIADSDQGAYTVIITNSAGTATSAGAILVTVPPVIVSQPANQTVLVGQAASFSVAVNGALPFSYQWQRDGVNIGGATNRILTISPAALADAGSYRIVVTNPSGVQTSSAATLSVYATAAPTLGSLVSSNGQFSLTLTGVPGFNYTIQASTNLVNWVPLGTNASPFTLVDTNASSFSRRFYRGLYLP
ncbi:MAG: hypothetical protein JWR69_432, partial [Pedosphaera sp.]|nr:hypothetical protein [Pedosphaera sp.]